ncbi:MAG: NADH:ubiquinone oxidoreductase subunit N, partial [Gammaproteobacteria bacterium]|nr:NADH:ubiquinone oxidoreductase subunit N [Gammaproteobacteria bacterium]
MNFTLPDFTPAIPEIFMLVMISVVLIVDLFVSDERRIITYLLAQATLVVTAVLTLGLIGTETQITFNGSFVLDPLAAVSKLVIYGVVLVAFAYSRHYLRAR